MSEKKWFYLALSAWTLAHYVTAFLLPLTQEEAYLAFVSMEWAPAYFDGPGGWPWLTALSMNLLGPSSLGLRLFVPLIGLIALWTVYDFGRLLYQERVGMLAALTVGLTPLLNVGATFASPVMPLLAAFCGSMAAAWRAVEGKHNPALFWMLAGGWIGFGLIFDYRAAFLLIPLLTWPLLGKKYRSAYRRPAIGLTFIFPALALYPAWIWNHNTEWLATAGWTWQKLSEPVWEYTLYSLLLPSWELGLPFYLLVFALSYLAARECRKHLRARFTLGLAGFFLMAVFYSAYRGLDDSAFFALLAGVPLLYFGWSALEQKPAAWPGILACALLLWLPGATSIRFYRITQATEALPWDQAAQKIELLRARYQPAGESPLFLIAPDAPLAAMMALHLQNREPVLSGHPLVYVRESQALRNQFALRPRYDAFIEAPISLEQDAYFTEEKGVNPFVGKSALYFSFESPDDVPQAIAAAFEKVVCVGEIRTPQQPEAKPLRVYWCQNYQTLPL